MSSMITLSLVTLTMATLLTSYTCTASPSVTKGTIIPVIHDTYPANKPQSVFIYTHKDKPKAAYRVIGIAKVSKYYLQGRKLQNEALHLIMKNLAASIGGDGIIEMNQTAKDIQAKVIVYQKILI